MAEYLSEEELFTQPKDTGYLAETDLFTPVGGIRPEKQNKGIAGDLGTSLKRGVETIPGMITGLADLPFALALGKRPVGAAADFAGEVTGFRPSRWAEEANKEYSPGYQQAQQDLNAVWEDPNTSGLDVAKEYLKNPAYIANQVVESLPSMAVGGVAAKGVMGAGKLATIALPAAEEAVAAQGIRQGAGYLERKLAERAVSKLTPMASPEAIAAAQTGARETAVAISGGVGEGLVQAGQSLNQAKGEDQRKNAIAALGSGVIDAVIGAGAGKIAQKLGLETAETAMVKAFDGSIKEELTGIAKLGRAGRIAGGGASEGILQELPQSAQEAVWQNYADGKPLWEGVPRQAIEGALAGFAMGAGANVVGGKVSPPTDPQVDATTAKVQETIINNLTPDGVTPTITPEGKVVLEDKVAGTKTEATAEDLAKAFALNEPVKGAKVTQVEQTPEVLQARVDELSAKPNRTVEETKELDIKGAQLDEIYAQELDNETKQTTTPITEGAGMGAVRPQQVGDVAVLPAERRGNSSNGREVPGSVPSSDGVDQRTPQLRGVDANQTQGQMPGVEAPATDLGAGLPFGGAASAVGAGSQEAANVAAPGEVTQPVPPAVDGLYSDPGSPEYQEVQNVAEDVAKGTTYRGSTDYQGGPVHQFVTEDGKNFSVQGEPTKQAVKESYDRMVANWARYKPDGSLYSVSEEKKKNPYTPEQLAKVKIPDFNLYGENAFKDINAEQALKIIDEDQALYEKIRECVG